MRESISLPPNCSLAWESCVLRTDDFLLLLAKCTGNTEEPRVQLCSALTTVMSRGNVTRSMKAKLGQSGCMGARGGGGIYPDVAARPLDRTRAMRVVQIGEPIFFLYIVEETPLSVVSMYLCVLTVRICMHVCMYMHTYIYVDQWSL